MTDDDLIARLREAWSLTWGDRQAAADRIEALVKERDAAYANGFLDAETEISATVIGQQNAFLHDQLARAKARAERLEAALQFYSCKDGCNDCSENERDLIGCGWTARAALKGDDHD